MSLPSVEDYAIVAIIVRLLQSRTQAYQRSSPGHPISNKYVQVLSRISVEFIRAALECDESPIGSYRGRAIVPA
jgi:hypothetical protein